MGWPPFIAAGAALLLMASPGLAGAAPGTSPRMGVVPSTHHAHHDFAEGHLPPGSHNVRLVGREHLTDIEGRISDVTYHRGYAYLGAWHAELGPGGCTGGVFQVDVTHPRNPVRTGFLEMAKNTYATEGIQALHLDTASFSGDVLLVSVESCGPTGVARGGGLDVWDITNPNRPVLLSRGGGDYTSGDLGAPDDTRPHEAHSTFGWQQDGNAYAALIDNEDPYDVDILDVTDPRVPVLVSETGLSEWPADSDGYGELATAHDLVAREIEGVRHLMVAYWDTGWVDLNVEDPTDPVFAGDTDYPACDPLVPDACPPEGNAHQSEWNRSGGVFIGTEEDESPTRLVFEVTEGPHQSQYDAGEFSWTEPIDSLPDSRLDGPTIFGGYGCPDDRDGIPTADEAMDMYDLTLGANEELTLVLERGPLQDPNHAQHDACLFFDKVETAQILGYDAAVVANHHVGAQAGEAPDTPVCGTGFEILHPGLCVGHRVMHLLFDLGEEPQTYPPDYTVPYPLRDPGDVEPDVGDLGWEIRAAEVFDGWGYARLFDAGSLEEIDQLAIPATLNPDKAEGFGTLSVHEVAVDRAWGLRRLAYLSWYDAGFRVAVFDGQGIRRTGFYIHQGGNDFWGVQLCGFDRLGRRLVCASDRDFGLYIFRYTGPTVP
jgi:hypothetical protein